MFLFFFCLSSVLFLCLNQVADLVLNTLFSYFFYTNFLMVRSISFFFCRSFVMCLSFFYYLPLLFIYSLPLLIASLLVFFIILQLFINFFSYIFKRTLILPYNFITADLIMFLPSFFPCHYYPFEYISEILTFPKDTIDILAYSWHLIVFYFLFHGLH